MPVLPGTRTGSVPEGVTAKVWTTAPCELSWSIRAASEMVFQVRLMGVLAATVVALAVNEMICGLSEVAVATGVKVGGGVKVSVEVDVLVGAGVKLAVKVAVGVKVSVEVGVTVKVGVKVLVGVGVSVSSGLGVGVLVKVGVLLGTKVGRTATVGNSDTDWPCPWQAVIMSKRAMNRIVFRSTVLIVSSPIFQPKLA